MQKPWNLVERTMEFAVSVYRFCRDVPRTEEATDIVRQLRRSGTSVAANYRAVCRGGTKRHFVSKLTLVIEEADEGLFWLEFLVRVDVVHRSRIKALAQEANELVAIFTASQKTARARMKASKNAHR